MFALAFEQERDVEHDHGRTAQGSLAEEMFAVQPHERMHNGLKRAQRRKIGENFCAEGFAVNAFGADHIRKPGRDTFGGFAFRAHQQVNGSVGIEHGNTQMPEERRRRGFAHGDGTGEADDNAGPAAHTPVAPQTARCGVAFNPPQGRTL